MASYWLKKPETFTVIEPVNQLITEVVPPIIVVAVEQVSSLAFLWSILVSLVLCFEQLINFHTLHLEWLQGNWEIALTSGRLHWHLVSDLQTRTLASISHMHFSFFLRSLRCWITWGPTKIYRNCKSWSLWGVSTPLHCKMYTEKSYFRANTGRKRAFYLIPLSVCVGRDLVAYVHREWT